VANEQPQPQGNPATSAVVGATQQVREAVEKMDRTLQRFESWQSPGMFRVTPAGSGGIMGQGRDATHERLRVREWVISVGAAGAYILMAGENPIATVQFSAAGSIVIPLPITIERGILITTAGVAAEIYDSFLITNTE
jgi:hypothetical protein